MTVKAICLTYKTPISIRGIEHMVPECNILGKEDPKKGEQKLK